MTGTTLKSTASLALHQVDIVRGDRRLLAELTLTLKTPQVLWVEGGNGIGKTSLLRTCAGLTKPDSGGVEWRQYGQPVSASMVTGYLSAEPTAKPTLSLIEDAALWGAQDMLNKVGLSAHLKTRTERLSTGQMKRLALAKLLAANKPIWVLDEPLAGLDVQGRSLVADLLCAHVGQGGLALIASHAPLHLTDTAQQRLKLDAS